MPRRRGRVITRERAHLCERVEAACLIDVAWRCVHRHAWMVKRGELSGFGGGLLEHPRQWLGAQWAGLFLGVNIRAA